jgi:RHS repeat-associated protein
LFKLYKAFGATRFTSGTTPTSYRYTAPWGHPREEISFGLYYYGARWYDPALGHFVQADTIVPDASHAGDYHRYAYTRFNPVKYTDPTGHIAVCFRGAPNSNKEEDPGNVFFQLCRQGLAAGGYDESVHGKIMEFDFNRVEDMQTAFQAILRRNRDEPVIVIGHSWGGAAALRLAKEFESYQQSILANPLVNTEMIDRATIDLLVTIDPERFGRWNTPDSVPHHSVRRAYNITPKDGWAENYGAPLSLDGFDWPWNFQNGTNNIEGALNVELAQVQGVEMNHSSIVDLNYRRANGDQPKVNPITRSLIAVGVCMALSHCK